MFKELEIMKALRYLLMVVAMMGVLSVGAQTPKYGTTYKPTVGMKYSTMHVQLLAATMSSTSSVFMHSGSSLPSAALSGTTTTYDRPKGGGPRRDGEDDGFDDDDDDPDNPGNPFPIGDGLWVMMVCAGAFALVRGILRGKRVRGDCK